jgi:hypothetical protein
MAKRATRAVSITRIQEAPQGADIREKIKKDKNHPQQ